LNLALRFTFVGFVRQTLYTSCYTSSKYDAVVAVIAVVQSEKDYDRIGGLFHCFIFQLGEFVFSWAITSANSGPRAHGAPSTHHPSQQASEHSSTSYYLYLRKSIAPLLQYQQLNPPRNEAV
jgi:hypothetical protein